MAQQQLNNQESAFTFRTKLNANFSDLYANKAQISHASATSTYGLGTTSLFGHVSSFHVPRAYLQVCLK